MLIDCPQFCLAHVILANRVCSNHLHPNDGTCTLKVAPLTTNVPLAAPSRVLFAPGMEVVYTLVNRLGKPATGEQVNPTTAPKATHFYDCYRGVEVTAPLKFDVEANGFGCLLATTNSSSIARNATSRAFTKDQLRGDAPVQPQTLGEYLQFMKGLTAKDLSSFSPDFHYLTQNMVPIAATSPLRPPHAAKPDEVFVPAAHFAFNASGVEIEGGANSGVDVQYPWETYPHRHHSQIVDIGAMYVDKYPVTNQKYTDYLAASKYTPKDSANWLKQNFAGGKPVPGWENKPVTYVSLDDARAYCAFNNKRLPHAFEWQYFAQGTDGRIYPWGGSQDNPALTPAVNNDWENPGPEPVGKYPKGASPFGVEDLVRSVWQYTSEFQDIHTRSVILRGGSNYSPWRGAECRWIENNDGTPKDSNACYEEMMKTPVPGSKPHPMGGSHWYLIFSFSFWRVCTVGVGSQGGLWRNRQTLFREEASVQ